VETRVPGENLRPDAGHKYNIQVILWQLALWSYISGGHQSTSRKPTSSHRSHTLNNIQAILWQPALWSYIGGGNRCTRRKSLTGCRLQTLSTTLQLYRDIFIGWGNQSTRKRKPPTCHRSQTFWHAYGMTAKRYAHS
jgi:hypothetical protein